MEILQLKYFVALACKEHLTNTAKEMMVTPSAIRISISRLEAELGCKLFDHVGRNISLNEYGKAYLPYAEEILSNLENGLAHIKELLGEKEEVLTLAVSRPQVWQCPIQAFHVIHPEIIINQISYDPISPSNDLIPQDIDLLITSPDSFSDSKWDSLHLFDDKILLAVPPRHRFFERTSIDLREAKDEHFVGSTLDSFSARCYEMCQEVGFAMQTPIKCDYTLRPKIMESENLLCFVTYHGTFTGYYSSAHLVEITNPSDLRVLNIYWRKSQRLSRAAQLARDFFIEYYKEFEVKL